MTDRDTVSRLTPHDHVFLGSDHEQAERRTWAVIILCTVMMIAEIVGGALFGSLALIADGLHMSTHAGALLLAALAYTCARKYAGDRNFTFGTGKFGDLAGFSSAIVLAMIALLIAYEAITRFLIPVPIAFNEAIPIAVLGLVVNVASAWLLWGGHSHAHGGHSHGHEHDHHHDDSPRRVTIGARALRIAVFEDNVPPRFRVTAEAGTLPAASDFTIETIRGDGSRQLFSFQQRGDFLESRDDIPEPHAFLARIRLGPADQTQLSEIRFEEHEHGSGAHHRAAQQQRANGVGEVVVGDGLPENGQNDECCCGDHRPYRGPRDQHDHPTDDNGRSDVPAREGQFTADSAPEQLLQQSGERNSDER